LLYLEVGSFRLTVTDLRGRRGFVETMRRCDVQLEQHGRVAHFAGHGQSKESLAEAFEQALERLRRAQAEYAFTEGCG
jgi:hypothetical protein